MKKGEKNANAPVGHDEHNPCTNAGHESGLHGRQKILPKRRAKYFLTTYAITISWTMSLTKNMSKKIPLELLGKRITKAGLDWSTKARKLAYIPKYAKKTLVIDAFSTMSS